MNLWCYYFPISDRVLKFIAQFNHIKLLFEASGVYKINGWWNIFVHKPIMCFRLSSNCGFHDLFYVDGILEI